MDDAKTLLEARLFSARAAAAAAALYPPEVDRVVARRLDSADGRGAWGDGVATRARAAYRRNLARVDGLFGTLLDRLAGANLPKDTVTIVLSRTTGRRSGSVPRGGCSARAGSVYDEHVRVPVVVRLPGRGPGPLRIGRAHRRHAHDPRPVRPPRIPRRGGPVCLPLFSTCRRRPPAASGMEKVVAYRRRGARQRVALRVRTRRQRSSPTPTPPERVDRGDLRPRTDPGDVGAAPPRARRGSPDSRGWRSLRTCCRANAPGSSAASAGSATAIRSPLVGDPPLDRGVVAGA